MTINLADNSPRVNYTVSSGVTQSAFVVPFEFFDNDDLNVYVAGTLKTLTTHYTTADDSGNTQQHTSGTTGYIHFTAGNEVTGASGGTSVVITRDIDLDRVTDFPTSGPFDVGALNTELDKIVAMLADIDDAAQRALILPDSDPTASITLPEIETRKNKVLSFDSDGALTTQQTIGTSKGTDTTTTTADYLKHDIIKSTTTGQLNNVYIAIVDTTSGDLLTDTTKFMLLVDAVAASASASNAATSETNAGNSETASGNSEVSAATSATKAENYAVKVDGLIPSTSDYSSKAWAVGGVGVTDTAGAGPAKDWAIDTTSTVDGTEFSAKEYSIGTGANSGMSTGSAKQWALGGGAGFDRDTAVTGSGLTAEFSAKYWANQAANSVQDFQDVYYGAFTSDTAAEDYQLNTNEGSVNVGDLYFNSSDNVVKVRTFSGWQDAAADTSSFATNGFAIAMSIAL